MLQNSDTVGNIFDVMCDAQHQRSNNQHMKHF